MFDLAAARGPDVGCEMEAAELLALLPERARAIAELRMEGLTFEAIGDAAGVTGTAMRDSLRRAARRVW